MRGIPAPPDPDLTFPCRAGKHRVRLDLARYWQRATCPPCRTEIDPLRLRRLGRWLRGAAPASRLRVGSVRLSVVGVFALLSLLYAAGLTAVLHLSADTWWVGTVLLFSGRWLWVLPVVPSLLVAALLDRRWLAYPAVAVAILGVGVMGFRSGWRTWLPVDDAPTLRVLTYNVEGGMIVQDRFQELVETWSPDVIALQECAAPMRPAFRALAGYVVDERASCFASRYPIDSVAGLKRQNLEAAGGSGLVVSYHLRTPSGRVVVTNVHLETPRGGLEQLIANPLQGGVAAVRANTVLRDIESRLARRWVDSQPAPRIVLGDFNTAPESRLFDRYWDGFTSAWDVAGRGFGYTKQNGWIQARIDHVLADDRWRVRGAWIAEDYGSDHLPLVVDLERITP